MPSVSLLIPAYNESATISDLIDRSIAVLKNCTPEYELIVLDDASKDNTWELLQEAKIKHPEIRIERHAINQGIATTFEDLYKAATKDFLFLISGDGQFPPETLAKCMPLLETHDVVICDRIYKDYTVYRHIISSAYRWLPRILFGVDLHDPGTIKCVRREIISDIKVISTSVFVEAERFIRAAKRGYKIAHVEMIQVPRKGGKARGGKPSTIAKSVKDMFVVWWKLQVLQEKP